MIIEFFFENCEDKEKEKLKERLKITIEIPKEFEEHFNNDRFNDSFERLHSDIKYNLENHVTMAGLYELELIEMLQNAISKAEVVKK